MTATWVPADTFGMRLRILRFELGLSVEAICAQCAIAPATWTKWEHGSQPRGLARIVERIVAVTGVDRDWLMWGGPLTALSTKWYRATAIAAKDAA